MKIHLTPTQRHFFARSLVTYGFGFIAIGVWQATVDAARLPLWAAIACVLTGLCFQVGGLIVVTD